MYKEFQRRRNVEALGGHLARMKSLEAARAEYEAENRRDMVLAVNYELASEAARTLLVIRKLEELGGVFERSQDIEPLRKAMQEFSNLPGIPRDQLQYRSPAEIDSMYVRYRIPDMDMLLHPLPPEPDPEIWDRERIMSHFGIGDEYFARKYQSYAMTLTMSGATAHWNSDIDDIGRQRSILTEAEVQRAATDFHQAVLNRVKLALHMEREPFKS
jgi:hypothetical protein